LNHVRKVGKKYRYEPSGDGRLPLDLTNDLDDPTEALQDAQDAFLANGIAAEVERVISRRQEREGNQRLSQELAVWVTRQREELDDGRVPTDYEQVLGLVEGYVMSLVG